MDGSEWSVMRVMFNYSCSTSFGGIIVYHFIITDSSDSEWIDLVHSDDESKPDEHRSVMENEEDCDLKDEGNNSMLRMVHKTKALLLIWLPLWPL